MGRRLEQWIDVGVDETISDDQARRLRVANVLALLGCSLASASVPFDAFAGPPWFLLFDLAAFMGFASALVANAFRKRDLSRVLLFVVPNLVFFTAAVLLGEPSDQRLVFFALATAPFLVFDPRERVRLTLLVALPVVLYFALEVIPAREPPTAFSIPAYRVYSAALTFSALLSGVAYFAFANRHAFEALSERQRVLDEVRARSTFHARMAALGEMSGGIAHEIRNPLTAIEINASQLEPAIQSGHPDRVVPSATRIRRSVRRIENIIDALLHVARDASDDPFESVPLQSIVDDALELSRQRLREHGVELVVGSVPDVEVECRATQLSQVLLNLFSNAHDAVMLREGERRVQFDAEVTDGELEMAVSDNGPGVPPELRERIFEPFFTTKPVGVGTGLGLGISRGIVAAHHGSLVLDETAALTRFVVRIPLSQSARPSRADEALSARRSSHNPHA